MIFKRNLFVKLPVLGMLALAAACGGGGDDTQGGDASGAATETPAAEAPATTPAAAPAAPAATGQVHEVRMVTTEAGASGVFEPATITVKKGDTVRFINDGGAAHNASFPAAENAGASNLPPAGPYLTAAGQTYDLVVNMDAGTYNFQCDPHAAMGMKGTLTVQ